MASSSPWPSSMSWADKTINVNLSSSFRQLSCILYSFSMLNGSNLWVRYDSYKKWQTWRRRLEYILVLHPPMILFDVFLVVGDENNPSSVNDEFFVQFHFIFSVSLTRVCMRGGPEREKEKGKRGPISRVASLQKWVKWRDLKYVALIGPGRYGKNWLVKRCHLFFSVKRETEISRESNQGIVEK